MSKFKNILIGLFSVGVITTVIPSGQTVIVPQTAVDRSPALESITFIHYRDANAKPASPGGGKTACYGFISKGAKLISPENIMVNPLGSEMANADVLNQTISSLGEWDNYTSAAIWATTTLDYTANFDSVADGLNEISFGPYSDPNVIAVTRIWGIFSGSPSARYIDQFDILFNTAYAWGDATINPSLMDYTNIATHEIGHGVGLNDLYNSCTDETMYGYSTEGETTKRDLNPGDIQGLQKLYGV